MLLRSIGNCQGEARFSIRIIWCAVKCRWNPSSLASSTYPISIVISVGILCAYLHQSIQFHQSIGRCLLLLYYFHWTSTADATTIEIKSDLPTYTHNIKYGIHTMRSTMKKKKVALNSWGEYDVFLCRRRCFQIVVLVCLLIQRRVKAFTVFEPI